MSGFRFESNREPLYKRLPVADTSGRRPIDFMMVIPGLRNLAPSVLDTRMTLLQSILQHREEVIFVDLNLPLNLLWVSVSQRNGLIGELSAEIRLAIPEARLVGHSAMPLSAPRAADDGTGAITGPGRALLFWRRC